MEPIWWKRLATLSNELVRNDALKWKGKKKNWQTGRIGGTLDYRDRLDQDPAISQEDTIHE